MMKILAHLLLCALTVTATAQQKPNKEETINFLEKTVKGSNYSGFITSEIEIEDDSVVLTQISASGKISRTFSHIKWAKLFMIQKVGSSPANCAIIDVAFADKLKHTASGIVSGQPVKVGEEQMSFKVAIPSAEYFNVREAFFRLAEIFRERNQNP